MKIIFLIGFCLAIAVLKSIKILFKSLYMFVCAIQDSFPTGTVQASHLISPLDKLEAHCDKFSLFESCRKASSCFSILPLTLFVCAIQDSRATLACHFLVCSSIRLTNIESAFESCRKASSCFSILPLTLFVCAIQDSNLGPPDYQSSALTI